MSPSWLIVLLISSILSTIGLGVMTGSHMGGIVGASLIGTKSWKPGQLRTWGALWLVIGTVVVYPVWISELLTEILHPTMLPTDGHYGWAMVSISIAVLVVMFLGRRFRIPMSPGTSMVCAMIAMAWFFSNPSDVYWPYVGLWVACWFVLPVVGYGIAKLLATSMTRYLLNRTYPRRVLQEHGPWFLVLLTFAGLLWVIEHAGWMVAEKHDMNLLLLSAMMMALFLFLWVVYRRFLKIMAMQVENNASGMVKALKTIHRYVGQGWVALASATEMMALTFPLVVGVQIFRKQELLTPLNVPFWIWILAAFAGGVGVYWGATRFVALSARGWVKLNTLRQTQGTFASLLTMSLGGVFLIPGVVVPTLFFATLASANRRFPAKRAIVLRTFVGWILGLVACVLISILLYLILRALVY